VKADGGEQWGERGEGCWHNDALGKLIFEGKASNLTLLPFENRRSPSQSSSCLTPSFLKFRKVSAGRLVSNQEVSEDQKNPDEDKKPDPKNHPTHGAS
jgi:hypothetical protein